MLKKKRKGKERTENKSFLFVWLICVNRVRLLHITHALVSTSSFPLCYCGGRVLRILQSTGVWRALLVCAQRDRHRETERETERGCRRRDRQRESTNRRRKSIQLHRNDGGGGELVASIFKCEEQMLLVR